MCRHEPSSCLPPACFERVISRLTLGWRSAGPRIAILALLAGLFAAAADASCESFDHSHAAWTDILRRWVRDGRVDYAGLGRDGGERLAQYLDTLSGACAADYEGWTSDERIAFWTNAYNAFTVRQILDHYPISSIRKIGWLPGAAFRTTFIPMTGLKGGLISLDDIEHRTLRSDFNEPRIHFALVCAARSCPPLRSEAYRGRDLDRQLDDQGRAFLRNPTLNRFDAPGRTLYLSAIFKWFRNDFEQGDRTLGRFVSRYMEDSRVAGPGVKIEFLEYDWSLNE